MADRRLVEWILTINRRSGMDHLGDTVPDQVSNTLVVLKQVSDLYVGLFDLLSCLPNDSICMRTKGATGISLEDLCRRVF